MIGADARLAVLAWLRGDASGGPRDTARPSRAALAGASMFACVCATAAGADNLGLDNSAQIVTQATDEDLGFRRGSVIVAPIPFRNPSLDKGLALGAAYMFQLDDSSDTSTIGLGGFRTANGSEGYGLAGSVSFDEGRWTITAVGVDADLNYAFYAGGLRVPIQQSMTGVKLEIGRRVVGNLTLGLGLDYGETSFTLAGGGPVLGGFSTDTPIQVYRISVLADHDTRDDTTYPTTGWLTSARFTKGFLDIAGGADYEKGVLSASSYWPVFRDGVFAASATFCRASKSAPFFDSCGLGAVDSFRGFESTEFIDEALISLQAEFRGRLGKRLGYVVFAGAGVTGDTPGDAFDGSVHSAAGAGLRFRLSRTVPVDYAVDVSVNQRGERLLYVSVGQRF